MHLMTELLVAAREADIERDARTRHFQSLLATCRHRLFGIVPIGPACDPRETC